MFVSRPFSFESAKFCNYKYNYINGCTLCLLKGSKRIIVKRNNSDSQRELMYHL